MGTPSARSNLPVCIWEARGVRFCVRVKTLRTMGKKKKKKKTAGCQIFSHVQNDEKKLWVS